MLLISGLFVYGRKTTELYLGRARLVYVVKKIFLFMFYEENINRGFGPFIVCTKLRTYVWELRTYACELRTCVCELRLCVCKRRMRNTNRQISWLTHKDMRKYSLNYTILA